MSKSNLKTRVEKYPLPDSIDGVVNLFREIMAPGLVQRVEFDISKPVRVIRGVDGEDLKEPNMDIEGAVRNINEIVEYTNLEHDPFETVVDMMTLVDNEHLESACWVIGEGGDKLLSKWFQDKKRGMPGQKKKSLMNLPLHVLTSLPEETLILCGSKYKNPDPDEISFAVKTAIEIRSSDVCTKENSVEGGSAGNSSRIGTEGSSPAARPVGPFSGGLHRVDWKGRS